MYLSSSIILQKKNITNFCRSFSFDNGTPDERGKRQKRLTQPVPTVGEGGPGRHLRTREATRRKPKESTLHLSHTRNLGLSGHKLKDEYMTRERVKHSVSRRDTNRRSEYMTLRIGSSPLRPERNWLKDPITVRVTTSFHTTDDTYRTMSLNKGCDVWDLVVVTSLTLNQF